MVSQISKYCGWLYFCGYQFSWIKQKVTHSWGSKLVALVFSFIIHTENTISWVLEFVDQTLHENQENWYPTKCKPFTVLVIMHTDLPAFTNSLPAFPTNSAHCLHLSSS